MLTKTKRLEKKQVEPLKEQYERSYGQINLHETVLRTFLLNFVKS